MQIIKRVAELSENILFCHTFCYSEKIFLRVKNFVLLFKSYAFLRMTFFSRITTEIAATIA